MTERTVAVKLVGRTDAYVREMDKAKRATGTFSKQSAADFNRLGTQVNDVGNRTSTAWSGSMNGLLSTSRLATLGAGAALGAFVSSAKEQASDLNESINAVNVTFGDAAAGVLAIGENSAKSFGLATSEFNNFAVQFSAFGKTIATGTGQDVATVIEDLATRAADFASVMNLDLNEATQVFMSTLSGETEPIRRFGKDVSAAAVEQYALTNGLAATKAELTEQIKVQARYGLLMQQTTDVTGDFANTADQAANASRIASAEWKNFQAQLGQELLPIAADVLATFTQILATAEQIGVIDIFGGVAKIPNSLFEGAENWGKTTRAIFTEFSLETKNNKIVRVFEEGEEAVAEFDRTMLDGLDSFDQVRDKVLELTGSEHAANVVASEWNKTHEQQVATYKQLNSEATSYAQVSSSADIAAMEHKEHVDEVRKALFRQGEITADTTAATYLQERADEEAATAAAVHADAVEDLQRKFDLLKDSLSDRSAYLNIEDAFDRVSEAATESWDASVAGAEDAEAKARDHELAVISLKQQIIDYVEEVGNIPPEVASEINTLIDQGSFDEAEAKLAWLERTRQVALIITPRDPTTNVYGRLVGAASGVSNWGGGSLMVGERGPELVDLPAGSTVHPAGSYNGGGSVSFTFGSIVLPNVTRPEQFIDGLAQAVRFTGPGVIRRLLEIG